MLSRSSRYFVQPWSGPLLYQQHFLIYMLVQWHAVPSQTLLRSQSVQASDIHHIEDLIPTNEAGYEKLQMQDTFQQRAHASSGPTVSWELTVVLRCFLKHAHAPSLPCSTHQWHCHPWQMSSTEYSGLKPVADATKECGMF